MNTIPSEIRTEIFKYFRSKEHFTKSVIGMMAILVLDNAYNTCVGGPRETFEPMLDLLSKIDDYGIVERIQNMRKEMEERNEYFRPCLEDPNNYFIKEIDSQIYQTYYKFLSPLSDYESDL